MAKGARGKHDAMEILQPDTVELPQKEMEKLNFIGIANTFAGRNENRKKNFGLLSNDDL